MAAPSSQRMQLFTQHFPQLTLQKASSLIIPISPGPLWGSFKRWVQAPHIQYTQPNTSAAIVRFPLQHACDKSLSFSTIFLAAASVCLIACDGKSPGEHSVLTRFTKDTHHLKSAHKPVTLRPVLGRQIHYLWHLGGPPYFVLLDCIWHSNQPKGYVIYIHCHFSLPVSPFQTWPRSLCTRIKQIVCPCFLKKHWLLTGSTHLFCPLSLQKKKAPCHLTWHA